MHQNSDVELSILENLFSLLQNNIFWDVMGFTGDRRFGKK
jgi:hypothetical protein